MTKINKAKHKTYSSYWSFENQGSKELRKAISRSTVLKGLVEKVSGQDIRRVEPSSSDVALRSFPSDPAVLAYRNAKLVEVITDFLSGLGLKRAAADIEADIQDYDTCFDAAPIRDLAGGMGYNNGLILFAFTRAVGPEKIVESGVWRGFTTYIMDHASGERADVFCFDINLGKVEWRSPRGTYHEEDISTVPLELDGARVLALFDDHYSHYDRLQLAYEKRYDFPRVR